MESRVVDGVPLEFRGVKHQRNRSSESGRSLRGRRVRDTMENRVMTRSVF